MTLRKLLFVALAIWGIPALADGNLQGGLDAEKKRDFVGALAAFQPLAIDGNAEAQYHMGLLYIDGVSRDMNLAVRWLEDSANQGYAPAQTRLGTIYVRGDGVMPDMGKGVDWIKKAAAQGFADAQVSLGVIYWNYLRPPDFIQAAFWFGKAAEQGDARGESGLGAFYMRGWGVPKDVSKAVYWNRKAAEQGYPDAEGSLGLAYQYGSGVPKDYSLAIYWYRKGAAHGNLRSILSLGAFYANGWGVPKDYVVSLALFDLSVDKLIRTDRLAADDAAMNQRILLKLVSEEQIMEGKSLAADMQRGGILPTLDSYILQHHQSSDGGEVEH